MVQPRLFSLVAAVEWESIALRETMSCRWCIEDVMDAHTYTQVYNIYTLQKTHGSRSQRIIDPVSPAGQCRCLKVLQHSGGFSNSSKEIHAVSSDSNGMLTTTWYLDEITCHKERQLCADGVPCVRQIIFIFRLENYQYSSIPAECLLVKAGHYSRTSTYGSISWRASWQKYIDPRIICQKNVLVMKTGHYSSTSNLTWLYVLRRASWQ